LYLAAQKLVAQNPRCADAIDRELAQMRERSRTGEFRSVAVEEVIIDFMNAIKTLPCAQRKKR
jgi:hypothetical protein